MNLLKSITNSIAGRNTILAAISAIAFLILGGIAISANQIVETAIQREGELAHLNDSVAGMKVASRELLLAAMDTIVDKDEGVVDPERKKIIQASLEQLGNGIIELEKNPILADQLPLITQLKGYLPTLREGIQVDLVRAVENRSDQSAFAQLDDVIDGTGDELAGILDQLYTSIGDKFQASLVESREKLNSADTALTWTMIIALAITLPLTLLMVKAISGRLNTMVSAMTELAEGNLGAEIPDSEIVEIHRMAQAVTVFRENAVANKRMADEAEKQREREQTLTAEQTRKDQDSAEALRRAEQQREHDENDARQRERESLANDFERSVSGLLSEVYAAIGLLEKSAHQALDISNETQIEASSAAQAAATSSQNINAVAQSTEEMTGAIREISIHASSAARVSDTAVLEAGKTAAQVEELVTAAQKIDNVAQLINEIAEQTNLLALNATIEAARAGDAGRGFAVVAAEVKNLSNQTAEATGEISAHIKSIQDATSASVKAVNNIRNTIGEFNIITTTIASAVEEQTVATQVIGENIREATNHTAKISVNIDAVTDKAEAADHSAHEVQNVSKILSEKSSALQQQIDGFIKNLRTS